MEVPPELAALQVAVPGLITALAKARLAGEAAGSLGEGEIELVRIATLVALGAPEASYRAHVARALVAGATVDEIWGSVAAVATLVGVPRILAAVPFISAALEQDSAAS